MIKNRSGDGLKSKALIKQIVEGNKTCLEVEGCTEQLTFFTGPGSDTCCRYHQTNLIEYGGLGKRGRRHSHHRKWVCSKCGYDVREDPRYDEIEDEAEKRQAMRSAMHGDHIIRKADGGDDTAENIDPLCYTCHNIKTVINNDNRS